MTEHIVAVFNSESAADAAARDLEQADIPAPAIRRYSPAASDRYAGSSTSSGGGFWAWLLGEEPATGTTRSLYRDEEFYKRRAQAGESVLSVRVDDDSRIHEVVSVLEAHHPIEIEENTEETGAASGIAVPAEGVRGVGDPGPTVLRRPQPKRSFRSQRKISRSASAWSIAGRPVCGATW